jgi:SOS-response transcriptional repressor LexA
MITTQATANVGSTIYQPKLSKRQQEVLDAAESLAKSGYPVATGAVAKVVGISPANASLVIAALRSKGVWRHPKKSKPAKNQPAKPMSAIDREAAAIKSVCDCLMQLDDAGRRRVLQYAENVAIGSSGSN